ncbi:MAG: extracellular solute-binding protein [Actinobacteria bacterium]|nr:extracellular solute-binding protein [Actinomycetota bacterium]
MVFADYGGTTRNARTEAFLKPFGEEFGVNTVSADADPAKLQLFAENKKAEWDLIDMDNWDVARFSKEGLLEKLPADVKRVDGVPKQYQEYASGGYTAVTGFGYRTGEGPTPKTWADFFNTEKFPGKRALPDFAYFQIEAALLAEGESCDQLYPLNFKKGFEKLDKIRNDVLFYDSFGQAVQYLAQGSVSMALIPNSRVVFLEEQELPVAYNWNEGFYEWTAAVVPKYAPHPEAAFALVNYMAQPEPQAEFSRLTKYGPTNSKALAGLTPETKESLPNAHEKEACTVNPAGLGAEEEKYGELYTEWLAQG